MLSCEAVGRREMGIRAVAGGDLEAIIILQGMERICPLRKSAVKTVKGKVRVVVRGEGMAWMLAGRSEGSVSEVMVAGGSNVERSFWPSCSVMRQLGCGVRGICSKSLLICRSMKAGLVALSSGSSVICQVFDVMEDVRSRLLLACSSDSVRFVAVRSWSDGDPLLSDI